MSAGHWRWCVAAAIVVLAACESVKRPQASLERAVSSAGEWSSVAELGQIARYRDHLGTLPEERMVQEYLEAKRKLEEDPVQRLRISLLLSASTNPFRDDEEAVRALRAFRRDPGGRPELVPFAELMLELLERSLAEREDHATTRRALSDESKRAGELSRQADELSRQIEALKAIETTRGSAAPAVPDEAQQ